MLVALFSSFTCADHESTMRHLAVVSLQLFLRNKMNGRVVFIKIIRHSLDRIFNLSFVGTLLRYNIALTRMFVSCSQLWLTSTSHLINSLVNRNCILDRILHTRDTADSIRMSLAYTFAPECICASLDKNRLRIETVQRKHSRIPANRNNTNIISLFCSFVHICKILWNLGMCIKTVNCVKIRCNLWTHDRKIRCRTTAQNHYIHVTLHR